MIPQPVQQFVPQPVYVQQIPNSKVNCTSMGDLMKEYWWVLLLIFLAILYYYYVKAQKEEEELLRTQSQNIN
jgi:protein-S-isoprenylcysteine O-methyltransferase Ste14